MVCHIVKAIKLLRCWNNHKSCIWTRVMRKMQGNPKPNLFFQKHFRRRNRPSKCTFVKDLLQVCMTVSSYFSLFSFVPFIFPFSFSSFLFFFLLFLSLFLFIFSFSFLFFFPYFFGSLPSLLLFSSSLFPFYFPFLSPGGRREVWLLLQTGHSQSTGTAGMEENSASSLQHGRLMI